MLSSLNLWNLCNGCTVNILYVLSKMADTRKILHAHVLVYGL